MFKTNQRAAGVLSSYIRSVLLVNIKRILEKNLEIINSPAFFYLENDMLEFLHSRDHPMAEF
jgi:hypothetical protein